MSDSRQLLELYRSGRDDAATALFDRYAARLLALANCRIGAKLKRRIEAEDVIQSAYRSFFVGAQQGAYEVTHTGDLWRLLAAITLKKLYRHIEKQMAGKRSIHREMALNELTDQISSAEPSAAEVVAVVEEVQRLFNALSHEDRMVYTAALAGKPADEIARSINRSERTVRRVLAEIRDKAETRLLSAGRHIATSDNSSIPPNVTLRFDDYVLEQMLASGGMGKVFRARDQRTGELVAIKALHKSRQYDERAVARFAQEAHILSTLQHPNLVTVRGLGRFPSGGHFMVMDLIEGADLQHRLQCGPLRTDDAIRVVHAVAEAVNFAHSRGIIHCDLKPANVLVREDGHVFVTDFGFAHLTSADAGNVYGAGGTFGYIAPEILIPGSAPSPAADIYSLGALLWTLGTGQPPSSDPSSGGIEDSLLAEISRRCLSVTPGARYPSVGELIGALSKHPALPY
jgi:eukaryotic-like serine/threonine-protein kinase